MDSSKKLNIFVGDQDYMMDHILRFKNPMTFMRYQKDFIVRARIIILSFIVFSAASLLIHYSTVCKVSHSSLAAIMIIIIGELLHLCTYYIIVMKKQFTIGKRLFFSFITILNKYFAAYEVGKMEHLFYHFFSISSSALLATPWYYHAMIEFAEFIFISLLKTGAIPPFFDALYFFAISTIVVGNIERFNKENWVLCDTFKSSYHTFKSIVDHLPQSMMILDKQGSIMYANKFAKETISVNCSTTLHPKKGKMLKKSRNRAKLCTSIQEAQREGFEHWLEDSFKIKTTSSITASVERKVENNAVIEESLLTLSHCRWKKIKAAIITLSSLAKSRKLYANLLNDVKVIHGIGINLAYDIERIYMDEKRKLNKFRPILEKINRLIPKFETHMWSLKNEANIVEKNVQHFDIISLFTYCIDNIVGVAFEKGITVSLSIEEGLPVDLDGDLNAIKDIIMGVLEVIFITVEKVNVSIRCETRDLSNGCNLSFIFTTKSNYQTFHSIFMQSMDPNNKYSLSMIIIKNIITSLGGTTEVVGNDEEVRIIVRLHFEIMEGNKSILMNMLELVENKKEKDARHIEWDPKIEPKKIPDIYNNSKIKTELSKLKQMQNANQILNANSNSYQQLVGKQLKEKAKFEKEQNDDKKELKKKENNSVTDYIFTQPKEEIKEARERHQFTEADSHTEQKVHIYQEEIKKDDTCKETTKLLLAENLPSNNEEFTRNIEEQTSDEFLTEKLPTSSIFSPSYSPSIKLITKMLSPPDNATKGKESKRNAPSFTLPLVAPARVVHNSMSERVHEYSIKIKTIYATKFWGSILQEVKVDDVVSQKILIVDDNEFIREAISKIILKNYSKVDIDIAKDGEMAVQKYKLTTKEGQKYIVIFMDIIMPNMDGIEATQEIRKYETAHSKEHTSIFGLSAPGNPNQVEECRACGMDDLLLKPISHESMCKVLKEKINSK